MEKRKALLAVGLLAAGIVCVMLILIISGALEKKEKPGQQTGLEMTEQDEIGENGQKINGVSGDHAVQQFPENSGDSSSMLPEPDGNDQSDGEVILRPSNDGKETGEKAGEDVGKETGGNGGKNDSRENGNREPSEGKDEDLEVELPIVPAKSN